MIGIYFLVKKEGQGFEDGRNKGFVNDVRMLVYKVYSDSF